MVFFIFLLAFLLLFSFFKYLITTVINNATQSNESDSFFNKLEINKNILVLSLQWYNISVKQIAVTFTLSNLIDKLRLSRYKKINLTYELG